MSRPATFSILLPVILTAILGAIAWGYTDRVKIEARVSTIEAQRGSIEKRLDRIEDKIDLLLQRGKQ